MRSTLLKKISIILSLKSKKFNRGINKTKGKLDGLSKSGSVSFGILGKAAAGFAIALAAVATAATLTAARTQVLNRVLKVMGETAGISADALNFYKSGIMALGIAEQQALKIQIRFIQSNLKVADSLKIARAAQNLAVLAGEDSSKTAQKLTDAINMQRPVLLKQFGIVASLVQIYGDMADEVGTTVDLLTDTQKKQAFLNTILRKAATVSGVYEEAMKDVGKRLLSIPRHIQTAANAFGQHLLPALAGVVDGITEFLKFITEAFQTTDQLTLALVAQGKKQQKLSDDMTLLADRYKFLIAQETLSTERKKELIETFKTLRATFPGIVKNIGNYTNVLGLNVDAIEGILKVQKKALAVKMEESIRAQAEEWTEHLQRVKLVSKEMEELGIKQKDIEKILNQPIPDGFFAALLDSAKKFVTEGTLENITGRVEVLRDQVDKLQGKGGTMEKLMDSLVQFLSFGGDEGLINLFPQKIADEVRDRALRLRLDLEALEVDKPTTMKDGTSKAEKEFFKIQQQRQALQNETLKIGLQEAKGKELDIRLESHEAIKEINDKFGIDSLEAKVLRSEEEINLEIALANNRLTQAQDFNDELIQIERDFNSQEFETLEERLSANQEASDALMALREAVVLGEIVLEGDKAEAIKRINDALDKYLTKKEIKDLKDQEARYKNAMKSLGGIINAFAGNQMKTSNQVKAVLLQNTSDFVVEDLKIRARGWSIDAMAALAKGNYAKAAGLSAAVLAAGGAVSFIQASTQRSIDAWDNADQNEIEDDPLEQTASGGARQSAAFSTRGIQNLTISPSVTFINEGTQIIGDQGLESAAMTIGSIAVAAVDDAFNTGELSVGTA